MSQHCNKSLDFLIGALLGGVLGSAASILMAPKSGRELREDICDTCEEIAEKAQEFTHSSHAAANGSSSHDLNYLVLGGLAGATIGAVSALLATPKSGKELRDELLSSTQKWAKNLNRASKSVAQNAGEQVSDFKEVIKDIAEKLMAKSDSKYGTNLHSRVDDIMDFANLGLRLLRGRKK